MSSAVVTYEQTDSDTTEAIFDGAVIAGYEQGRYRADGSFHSEDGGITVSYGRGFDRWKWFGTDDLNGTAQAKARAWIEKHAEDLRDR